MIWASCINSSVIDGVVAGYLWSKLTFWVPRPLRMNHIWNTCVDLKKTSLTSIELRSEFSFRPVDRPFLRYLKVSFFVLGVLDFVSFQHWRVIRPCHLKPITKRGTAVGKTCSLEFSIISCSKPDELKWPPVCKQTWVHLGIFVLFFCVFKISGM